MLTIKDLSADHEDLSEIRELDHSAMSDVRGGVNEGYQSQNVFNSAVDYKDLDVLKFAIGGGNFVI